MDITNSGLKFHELGLDDRILEAIARSGWKEPTMIQEKAIPLFMRGKDILARARTGSGKTGAYLVPLIHTLLERKAQALQQVTSTLILSPSKELCKQIKEHLEQLTSFCMREITYIDISPQVPIEAQKSLLNDNPDILIGTPFKVLNHLQEGNLILKNNIQFFIIDEADLIFTHDYEKELTEIFSYLPSICQYFITSATMTDDVSKLKKCLLKKPVTLTLEEPPLPPDTQLTQYIAKVNDLDKSILLYAAFKMNLLPGKTIIFVNTIEKGYKIHMFLLMFQIKCCTLSAELPLNCRCRIVDDFNSGEFPVLIASDEKIRNREPAKTKGSFKSKIKLDRESGVARGIDFQHVSSVINYDVPEDVIAYIHRVGRTARMGNIGTAITMVSHQDKKKFLRIEKDLKNILGSNIIFKNYKFNLTNLDAFRYRATDAWKQCTSIAVRDFRRREIKRDIMNSEELKSFFDNHPKDLKVIKHNLHGKIPSSCPYLRNLPNYMVPTSLKSVVGKVKDKSRQNKDKNKKPRNRNRKNDPLRSLKFEGFRKAE